MLDFCVWECCGPNRVTCGSLKGFAVSAGRSCRLGSLLVTMLRLKGRREGVELLLLGIYGEAAQEAWGEIA